MSHLLLGDPGHGIVKDPPSLGGAHTASVPSCGHTTTQLLLESAVHMLELIQTVEFYKMRKYFVNHQTLNFKVLSKAE